MIFYCSFKFVYSIPTNENFNLNEKVFQAWNYINNMWQNDDDKRITEYFITQMNIINKLYFYYLFPST